MKFLVKPECPHDEIVNKIGEFCYNSWNGKLVRVLRFEDTRLTTPIPYHRTIPSYYGIEPSFIQVV